MNYLYTCFMNFKIKILAGHQWFMPVILATQKTAIRRIEVQSQLKQVVFKTLSQKYPT
jgi:hypothetical protein